MTECSDQPEPGDVPAGAGETRGRTAPAAGGRLLVFWHRVRSGEDPWAFGAVVIVVALAAGLAWFWAGARHGGVAVASASPGSAHERGARPAAGSPGPTRPGRPGGDPSSDAGDPAPGDTGSVPAGGAVEPAVTVGAGPSTTGPALAVHVAGAVAHAGLYRLPAGSRVADAIAVAGGSLPRADLDRLNLAARLADAQRIYVVRRGELPPPGPLASGLVDGAAGDHGETGVSRPTEPVDLNTADLAALDSLPGVGPATARAILEERSRLGGFRSTRDLLRVPGIGEGRLARLKDHIRV